jgi:hypothetical protein
LNLWTTSRFLVISSIHMNKHWDICNRSMHRTWRLCLWVNPFYWFIFINIFEGRVPLSNDQWEYYKHNEANREPYRYSYFSLISSLIIFAIFTRNMKENCFQATSKCRKHLTVTNHHTLVKSITHMYSNNCVTLVRVVISFYFNFDFFLILLQVMMDTLVQSTIPVRRLHRTHCNG